MPGSTTVTAMPYPLATEPVSQGDDAIKALADRVEAYMLGSSGTATAGANLSTFAYRLEKRGQIAVFSMVTGTASASGIAANATICTLPAGFRPAATYRSAAQIGSGTATFVTLDSAGVVTCPTAVPASTGITFQIAFPIA